MSLAVAPVQPALDLDAADLSALRAAYTAAGYRRRGITFKQALECKHLRLALELHAAAIARTRPTPH